MTLKCACCTLPGPSPPQAPTPPAHVLARELDSDPVWSLSLPWFTLCPYVGVP